MKQAELINRAIELEREADAYKAQGNEEMCRRFLLRAAVLRVRAVLRIKGSDE